MSVRGEKFRGKRTHGRGRKAGRGKGKRGGSGMAGVLKHRFTWVVVHDPDRFGRHGFKRPQSVVARPETINVSQLERALRRRIDAGEIKGKPPYEIDLSQWGFDKLLGSGTIRTAVKVRAKAASAKAVEKVEAAGGSVETG